MLALKVCVWLRTKLVLFEAFSLMVQGTLPPGELPSTFLEKKKVADTWSLSPKFWSYLPRYSFSLAGMVKRPEYAPPPFAGFRAPFGSGMEDPILLLTLSMLEMVVSSSP